MVAINKLYGVLLGTVAVPDMYKWYIKKFTPLATNDKVQNILKILLLTVSLDKRAMFACLICNAILHTAFGKEISELDPVNTYIPVGRPPDSGNDDPAFCLKMETSPDVYMPLKQFLDEDIIDRLNAAATWIDYIAAGCLQILRELNK
jgi:hypothetical protein